MRPNPKPGCIEFKPWSYNLLIKVANLQLANECNLFSYSFSRKNQGTLPKTQGIIPKTFQIWAKNSRIWKKTQGYEALLGLLGLQKVHKKQAWFKAMENDILITFGLTVRGKNFISDQTWVMTSLPQKLDIYFLLDWCQSQQGLTLHQNAITIKKYFSKCLGRKQAYMAVTRIKIDKSSTQEEFPLLDFRSKG